jgi:hypothetical protein
MKITPSSELFDDYSVETESWGGVGEVEKSVIPYAGHSDRPDPVWASSNDKYSAYGTGKPYKRAKLAFDAEDQQKLEQEEEAIAQTYLDDYGDQIANDFIALGLAAPQNPYDLEPFIKQWQEDNVFLGIYAKALEFFYTKILDKIIAKM